MSWLRGLIRVSSRPSPSSPSKSRLTEPFSYSLTSCFTTDAVAPPAVYSGLRPTKAGEKPRVVVLGTGWAGCRLMKEMDTKRYDVVCYSPRNHMVFTPLLASTCVGTLEFRLVAEPIGRNQPAISREPGPTSSSPIVLGLAEETVAKAW